MPRGLCVIQLGDIIGGRADDAGVVDDVERLDLREISGQDRRRPRTMLLWPMSRPPGDVRSREQSRRNPSLHQLRMNSVVELKLDLALFARVARHHS